MVAGPKLKLSILIVATLAGLSPGLTAWFGLAPAVNANAVARIAADPNIHLILFIFLSPLKFLLKAGKFAGHASSESTIASECEPCT